MTQDFKPLFEKHRYTVYYGGRGGQKSWAVCQALILQAVQSKQRILCTREFQGSIRESVHKLLADTIDRMQLNSFFTIGVNTIVAKNGSTFIFEGLRNNVTKIKSLEGVDICFVEEAESITEFSWDILIPTIRKAGSRFMIIFNPFDEMDSTYQRFVAPYHDTIVENGFYTDETVYVRKTGWEDNPWFPDELRQEMEKCKKENYNKWLHIWQGEPSTDFEDSIIKPEWVDAAIDAHIQLKFKPRGVQCLGFDPADTGNDDKAIVMRHGVVVTLANNWKNGDLEEATVLAYDTANDNNCTDLVYDNIGVGAGAKVKFRQLQGNNTINVQGFCGSEQPDNPDQRYKDDRKNGDLFRNKRAQYWWYLADRFEATFRAIEHGEYSNPNELISLSSDMKGLKLLKSELTRVQRKRSHTANSLIQIESKDDMKARALKSPNLADALVYCFANKDIKQQWNSPLDYSRMNA